MLNVGWPDVKELREVYRDSGTFTLIGFPLNRRRPNTAKKEMPIARSGQKSGSLPEVTYALMGIRASVISPAPRNQPRTTLLVSLNLPNVSGLSSFNLPPVFAARASQAIPLLERVRPSHHEKREKIDLLSQKCECFPISGKNTASVLNPNHFMAWSERLQCRAKKGKPKQDDVRL